MKENWQPLCRADNKVCQAEPWRNTDFGLQTRAEQNTEIYKVFTHDLTVYSIHS